MRQRLESVDVLRGLVMIVMALDHTRDFFGAAGNPTDLSTASTALFFTRWITSFCAPVFFLLTGTGARLSLRRRTRRELSAFLFTRGLWLLFLEVVVLRCLAYQFNVDYRVTMLIVIWALGWAMIVLSVLVLFPPWVATAFGAILVAGHNLFGGAGSSSALVAVLHGPGFVVNSPRVTVFAAYPLVPWVGVTALGYSLGQLYTWTPERRRHALVWLGGALTVLFVVLRAVNRYGDPVPWTHERAVLSFLNTNKYPPSLLFLLMTLGPALLVLAALDRHTPQLARPALVMGKVPLAFFVLHFAVLHALAVVVCFAGHGTAHWMFESPDLGNYPFTRPPGWGSSLPVVYGVWIAVVLALFPFCRWYAGVKARRTDRWLSYL